MKKLSKKPIVIFASTILLACFVTLIVHNYQTKTSFKYSSQNSAEIKPEQNKQDAVSAAVNKDALELATTRKNSSLMEISDDDFVLGDKNAPVTIIEYASLSCPHCAAFSREAFNKLKSNYIENGKVKFIFRNFPLNQPALTAAMFAICQAEDSSSNKTEKYFSTLKALFKTQDSWAFNQEFAKKLEAIAQLDGMSPKRFQECINNKSLQNKILSNRISAAKTLKLRSAPSFFVNGEISEGYVDYQTIRKLIEKKLSENTKNS